MLDHIGIRVPPSHFDKTVEFYEKALGPLGYKVQIPFPAGVGLGTEQYVCDFWIHNSEKGKAVANGDGVHYAFKVKTHEEVDAFHAAAMSFGAADNGKPGFRSHYHQAYYSGFAFDPAGNNVEVVCQSREEALKKGVEVKATPANQ